MHQRRCRASGVTDITGMTYCQVNPRPYRVSADEGDVNTDLKIWAKDKSSSFWDRQAAPEASTVTSGASNDLVVVHLSDATVKVVTPPATPSTVTDTLSELSDPDIELSLGESEDESHQPHIEDKAVPSQVEDKAFPSQEEDEAVPSQVEDEALPIQVEDEAVPSQVEDEALPIQVEDEARQCEVPDEDGQSMVQHEDDQSMVQDEPHVEETAAEISKPEEENNPTTPSNDESGVQTHSTDVAIQTDKEVPVSTEVAVQTTVVPPVIVNLDEGKLVPVFGNIIRATVEELSKAYQNDNLCKEVKDLKKAIGDLRADTHALTKEVRRFGDVRAEIKELVRTLKADRKRKYPFEGKH